MGFVVAAIVTRETEVEVVTPLRMGEKMSGRWREMENGDVRKGEIAQIVQEVRIDIVRRTEKQYNECTADK
jgi:hypothetical protein